MKTQVKNRKGFTLVEFLVALGLFAGILTAVYSMLYSSAQGWKNMRHRSELYQAGRVILERIEEDLEHSIPVRLFIFSGEKNSLSFPALISPAANEKPEDRFVGRVLYSWVNEEPGSTGKLKREWEIFSPEDPSFPTHGSDTFPSVVSEISFSYAYESRSKSAPLGVAPSGAETLEWEERWSSQREIPQGVRVKVVLESPESPDKLTLEKIVHVLHGSLGKK